MTFSARRAVIRIGRGEDRYGEYWYWVLYCDDAAVAESIGEWRNKQELLDFIIWLRELAKGIPILGEGEIQL